MDQILGCLKNSLPFSYMGVLVGANMLLKKNWKPIVDKFQSKLSNWKANSLSFGGKIDLDKTGFGKFTYILSVIIQSTTRILDSLEKKRIIFLWGGTDVKNKIHWVDWLKVMADKNDRGLEWVLLKLKM